VSQIVVVGDLMVDVVVRLTGPLAQASDAPAEISFRGGGSAANTAAWLAEAGADVALVARVGDDERGRSAVEELRAEGVDTRIAVDAGGRTGTCLVLIDPGGERTMAPDAGANDALAAADLAEDLLAAAAHLHVSGYALLRDGSRAAARSAIERAVEAGIGVSVDPSSSALLDASFLDWAAGANLLMPNASEAHALTGDSDPEAAGRALAERFGEVVVTLGPGGALWTNGGEVLRAAAEPVDDVEDSTGAGDAFAAAFLSTRVQRGSTAESLAAGCKLAARAVKKPGARP
jgi:ribokinase